MPVRSSAQRIADTRRRLEHDPNVWLATAAGGIPHLIPLSLAWYEGRILVATPTDSRTVSNVTSAPRARASLDSADDVVIVDATVEVLDFGAADPATVDAYVERVGWDPREQSGDWSLLVLTPTSVQAWNGEDELHGRTVMRDGDWVA